MANDARPPIDKSEYREILGACVAEFGNVRPNVGVLASRTADESSGDEISVATGESSLRKGWIIGLAALTLASVLLTFVTSSSKSGALTLEMANAQLQTRIGSAYPEIKAMETFVRSEPLTGIGDPNLAPATNRLNQALGYEPYSSEAIKPGLFQERNGALVYIEENEDL